MSEKATEARHGKAEGLDRLPPVEILALLAKGQQAASQAVDAAIPEISKAADLVAASLRAGRKLVYAGAGSAGLMAAADAMELPGTYGISPDRIAILLAGGLPQVADIPGGPEDDTELGERDAAVIEAGDCVLCVSASGTTPYTLAVAKTARRGGASVVAIANNPGAPLFRDADAAILLATPPEVIAGSTRMGAGTAQKIAFNMLSTLAAIKLGHVHDGHMVNLRADNEKLRIRAARMVADIVAVPSDEARIWVDAADGSVKVAVLLAAGVEHAEEARAMLAENGGLLRTALEEIQLKKSSMKRA
jgi:Predicted sugar phosphate isomerase